MTNPRSIRFVGGPKEVLVGQTHQLFVALADERDRFFDNCSAVPFTVDIADTSIFRVNSIEPCTKSTCPPGACKIYKIIAIAEGETYATANYLGYEAQVLLVSYQPLKVSHPVVLVSLGASFKIGIQGGPKAWKSYPGHHYETVTAKAEPSAIHIAPTRAVSPESPWRLYTLTCKALGTQKIVVEVQNNAPGTEKVVQTTEFEYRCREPTSLFIYPTADDTPSMPDDCIESKYLAIQLGLT